MSNLEITLNNIERNQFLNMPKPWFNIEAGLEAMFSLAKKGVKKLGEAATKYIMLSAQSHIHNGYFVCNDGSVIKL